MRLIGKGPDASGREPSVQGHPVVMVCGRAGRGSGSHDRGDSPRRSPDGRQFGAGALQPSWGIDPFVGGCCRLKMPSGPFDVARHLILPALTLAAPSMTVIARVVRASVLETVGRDYVRTAQAKGLHDFAVVSQHILKNALIPVITLLGLQVGFLLGGAAIVEVVFSYPGIGNLMVKSIVERDLPVTQGCVLLIASVYVLVNIGADVLQAYLDPRIRVT